MLDASDQERHSIVDYLASQAPDETVEFLQKLHVEQVHGVAHAIWDAHTDKGRWWVISPPTNLYSQAQFPNMDLALTFHVGLCIRVPRSYRDNLAELPVEPLLGAWRSLEQAHAAVAASQEVEDYQAIGVRCRESLITLIHLLQDAVTVANASALKRSDFLGWAEVMGDTLLSGASQKARRQLVKSAAKSAWEFVNWLTHSKSGHFHDAEAAVAATEHVINLFTTACIRHVRGVPECCPSCGSQRLAPERGVHTGRRGKVYERPVCPVCNWTGEPVEVQATLKPAPSRSAPEGDCVTMDVPLRGSRAPRRNRDG